MRENIDQIRDFIRATEMLLTENVNESTDETEIEEEVSQIPNAALFHDLEQTVFKLRAFMETAGSDEFALGVETGMARAADMIVTIIDRYQSGSENDDE